MEQFSLKPEICFGPDALDVLDGLTGRVMVITDEFLAKSGLLDRVLSHLKGCTAECFTGVRPDPSLELVARGARALADFQPQAVVAFGGGSPMDCAKAMLYFGRRLGAGEGVRFYAVPTTAGTGSEVTSFAVLTDTAKGVKYPLVDKALLPHTAILDPGLVAGLPPAVVADTGMDVLAHAAEARVARRATPFSDALAEKAFAMAYQNLRAAFDGPDREQARGEMLLASNLAGIAFDAAGLGICHSLAHALGGRYHVPHGRLNALLLPAVIAFNAQDARAAEGYGQLARRCGLAANPRALAAALSRLRAALGLPDRLAGCGVERSALEADGPAIVQAALGDLCTPSNPRQVTGEELRGLLRDLA